MAFRRDKECERKLRATVAGLVAIHSASGLEDMLAAELLASHYTAMEYYR